MTCVHQVGTVSITKVVEQCGPGFKPNTVHLSVCKPYITSRVFWDRLRWRVFLLAFRPAFVSATTSASA